jgi:hypothetical protein
LVVGGGVGGGFMVEVLVVALKGGECGDVGVVVVVAVFGGSVESRVELGVVWWLIRDGRWQFWLWCGDVV